MLAHLSIKIVCQIPPPPQAWERLVEAPAGLPSYFRDLSGGPGRVAVTGRTPRRRWYDSSSANRDERMDIERIGKYKVLEEIGRGTMGRVYKAHDPVLNRLVAIKTMSASVDAGDEMHKRFHREAQAAALLSHPNIVTVHDFGEEQDLIFMAMELLEGTDLRDAIERKLLPGLHEKVRVMEQICSALAFAHSKGVVHRDLKPANVHIQPNGQVKIVDFGLARMSTSNMTQEGIVLGTPNYMSPEQALGDKVDARSDIFSAGAVFYELLTNHKPFDADSTPGVLFQVVHKEPPAIRQWSPEVPRILVEVVEKAMVKGSRSCGSRPRSRCERPLRRPASPSAPPRGPSTWAARTRRRGSHRRLPPFPGRRRPGSNGWPAGGAPASPPPVVAGPPRPSWVSALWPRPASRPAGTSGCARSARRRRRASPTRTGPRP